MPVMMPQKKSNQDGEIMSAIGKFAGSKMGGDTGGQIGGAIGGLASDNKGNQQMPTQGGAMQRRSKKLGDDQNLASLENANNALQYLPPEQQNQYAPALQKALEMERKNRGIA